MWSSSGRERGAGKGFAPFTAKKHPRSHVHEPRQFFHCFGCDEKGDVISFLVKIEQRPFMDVLTDLAAAAGVDLEVRPLTPAERKARKEAESERDRMFRALDLAASFFEEQYLVARRRGCPRLRRGARHRHGRRARSSASATRRRAGMACRRTWPARRSPSPTWSGSASCARQRARALRLLPRPGDAAGDRSPEARRRLRQPPARSGRQGSQVRQLARVAALSQEGAALWPARRAGGDPQERQRRRRRGELRRAGAARGGHRGGGRADGDRADRRAGRGARAHRQDGHRGVRRRHRRPARRAEGGAAVRGRRRRRPRGAPAGRASIPTTSCAAATTAPPRSGAWSTARGRCSISSSRTASRRAASRGSWRRSRRWPSCWCG